MGPSAAHEALATAAEPSVAASRVPAFDDVYDAHFDAVVRCLVALGVPPHQVDDAAQDVFVVVHRRLADFEARSSVKTWVIAIALRVAKDHRRGARRRGTPVEVDDDLTDERAAPDERASHREQLRAVAAALEDIDVARRQVFVLAEIEGMTAPEIADAMELPVNTVYSRLRLARDEFSRAIARREGRPAR